MGVKQLQRILGRHVEGLLLRRPLWLLLLLLFDGHVQRVVLLQSLGPVQVQELEQRRTTGTQYMN